MRSVDEQLLALESTLRAQKPIPVITYRTCEHETCGSAAPAEWPEDALLIELGCEHAIASYDHLMTTDTTPDPEAPQIPEILKDQRAPAASPQDKIRRRIVQLNLR